MTVANRLRLAMKQKNVPSEAALHRITGVQQPTIHRILSGESRSPRLSNIEPIANALGVSVSWLLCGDGPVDQGVSGSVSAQSLGFMDTEDCNTGLLSREIAVVSSFEETEITVNGGLTSVVRHVAGNKVVLSKTLQKGNVLAENAALVKVSGSAMSYVLPHGANVCVDTTQKKIIDGDLYAIDHDGMLRVSLIYRLPGGGIRLSSYNKASYPDEEYDQAYTSSAIIILGRVFWYESFI